MTRSIRLILALGVFAMVLGEAAVAGGATVLYGGKTITVENTLKDPTDLWVSPEDLTRINGFVLKPEGACLDDICIPLRQDGDNELFVTRDGKKWINATALAKTMKQGYAADYEHGVWSFAEIPATQSSYLQASVAPDFEMKDRQGKTVRLSDFRGKKVLIVTWASW